MLKRIFIGLVALGALGLGGLLLIGWQAAIAPVAVAPPGGFAPGLVARGAALAGAGYCSTCHTAAGGRLLAGGRGLDTGFGTIHSTNITPDAETGIGRWSLAAFRRAMHKGVARDGSHLFPAFPYDHFTKVSDADVEAIYAWLMTRPAVRAEPVANTIPFPLNIRMFQAGWKLLYFKEGRFVPDRAKSAEWNRGAYLAEGLAHCGGCHTPRGALGAELVGRDNQGAVIDGWIAPSLVASNPAPVAWDRAEIFAYLRGGATAWHGSASGPMSPVVHDGLSALPDSDVMAIAAYFADGNGSAAAGDARAAAWARARAAPTGSDADARLYAAACGSCHYNAGATPVLARPELALNSALYLAEPTNLIQAMVHGIGVREGAPGLIMPAYGRALGDADMARIANYLRRTRTPLPPWTDVEKQVAMVRKGAAG